MQDSESHTLSPSQTALEALSLVLHEASTVTQCEENRVDMLESSNVLDFFKACGKTDEYRVQFVQMVSKKAHSLFRCITRPDQTPADAKKAAELARSLENEWTFVKNRYPPFPAPNSVSVMYGKVLLLQYIEQSMHHSDLKPEWRKQYPAKTLFLVNVSGDKFQPKNILPLFDKWLKDVYERLRRFPSQEYKPEQLLQMSTTLEGTAKLEELTKTSEYVSMFYQTLQFNLNIANFMQNDMVRFSALSTITLYCSMYYRLVLMTFLAHGQRVLS